MVVCTRDRPAELERCLRSLSRLDYPSFEAVVVDNASSDSTARAVAGKYGARYVFDPVPGLSHARNVGAHVCRSEIVAFIDDDAVAEGEWLGALAREFADPEVAAVAGRCLPLKMETEAEQCWAEMYGMGWGPTNRTVLDRHTPGWFSLAAFGGLGTGGCMAFRQSAFETWPGFDERLGRGTPLDGNEEHYAFFSLVRLGYKVVGTPHAIVRHPCPATLDALRVRRLKDHAALGGYFCMFLVEEDGYRLETLRHIGRKMFSDRTREVQKNSAARIFSPGSALLSRLRGPWLYLLSTWAARKNSKSSRALVPFVARALSYQQTSSTFDVAAMRQVSDPSPEPRRA